MGNEPQRESSKIQITETPDKPQVDNYTCNVGGVEIINNHESKRKPTNFEMTNKEKVQKSKSQSTTDNL